MLPPLRLRFGSSADSQRTRVTAAPYPSCLAPRRATPIAPLNRQASPREPACEVERARRSIPGVGAGESVGNEPFGILPVMQDHGDDLEVRLTWLSDSVEDSADDRPNLPGHNPPAVSDAGERAGSPGSLKLAEAVAGMRRETAALRSLVQERLDVLPDIATSTREALGLLDEMDAVATIHAGAHSALAAAVADLAQRTARTERGLALLVDEVVALREAVAAGRVGPSKPRTTGARVRATAGAPAKASPPAPPKRAPMTPTKTTSPAPNNSAPSVGAGVRAEKAAPRPSGKANPPEEADDLGAGAAVRLSSSSSNSGRVRKPKSNRPLVGRAPA